MAASADSRWYVEHTALIYSTLKWSILGSCSGICVGLATRGFLTALRWSSSGVKRLMEGGLPYYYCLPLALPLCVFMIRTFAPSAKGHGTEAVIAAVHENYGKVDWRVAPIKLAATILTIAFGGSVGKEGPCAQIGAALTSLLADILRLGDDDRRRLVICGISAAFAAVFGSPVAGAIFGIEVLYIGRIEYPVLLPCLIAGITSHLVCGHIAPTPYVNEISGRLGQPQLIMLAVAFGSLCGLVALALIKSLKMVEQALERFADHPYLTAFCGGLALILLYRLCGSAAAGLGTTAIGAALQGAAPALMLAFAIKILATSLTLEVGGSGGIITPLFYIGATFGAAFAHILHLPVGLFAAFGFVSVAAAGANTPLALSVMAVSMLPQSVGVYAALSACTAYLLVGHRSVYASQMLGVVKSSGLVVTLGAPVGGLTRRKIKIQPGSATERILRFGNQHAVLLRRKNR